MLEKIRKLVPFLFLFCLLTGGHNNFFVFSHESNTTMHKQIDFWRGTLSATSEPTLGKEFDLQFSVNPIEDASGVFLKFFLPEGIELISGDTQWTGDLKKDELFRVSITVMVTTPGEWEVSVWIESQNFSSFDRAYLGYITSTAESGDLKILSLQTEEDSAQCNTGLVEETDIAGTEGQISSQTTVYGYIYYKEDSGSQKSTRYATAELWEDGFLFDTLLSSSWTDSVGKFSFSIDISSSKNIYVKIFCESSAARTTKPWLGTYWGRCPNDTTKTIYPGQSNYIGSYSFLQGSDSHPWQAMDYAITEYQWIDNKVGWTRSQVEISFPDGSWPNTNGNKIFLPDKGVWPWDKTTLYHEYGHCVMYALYGRFPSGSGPSRHDPNDESSLGFAMTEGWAEFMQCAVTGNSSDLRWYNCGESGSIGNIETNTWHYGNDCDNDWNGDIIEGAVASIFWDIFDGTNDDNLSMGFSVIFDIIRYEQPDSIHQFWNGWNSGYWQELWEVFYNHGINKDTTAPNTTITSGPSGTITYDDVTFQWTGTDNVTSTSNLVYSYYLQGYDSGWSSYTSATSKSYNNLSNGTYTFQVRAKDQAGNVDPTPDTKTFTVNYTPPDTTPPNTTITSGPSGTITYDDVTFQWTGTDNVTSTSNLVYSYYLQGYDSGWSSYTSATSKTYSNLPNGTYTFQVRAKDQAGNVDPTPDTKTFTVNYTPPDTTPPNTTITSGPSGTITYDDVTFQWTGTDNVTSTSNLVYSYYLQGYDSGWSSYTSATSKSYNNLSNGTYTFQVRAKDQAGNVDPTPDTKTFTVQVQVGSEVTFLEPLDGDTVTPNENGNVLIRVEYTGSDCPYYFDIYIDGIRKAHIHSYSPCTISASYYWPTFEYSDGYYSIYACVTDQGGTLIAESDTISVYLDNPQEPQIQITDPLNNEVINGSLDITAKVTVDPTFAYDINKVGFFVDGSNIGWVFDPSGQENSYTFYYTLYDWDSTTVSDGQHTILARVYDQYDRSAEHSITVTVQQTSPVNVQFNTYYIFDFNYGNSDGIINPGELIGLFVVLGNTGTQPVYGVTATAATTSPYINYSCAYPPDLTSPFGDIPGGATGTGYMCFMVSNAPDGTIITFDLTITDMSSNTWYDSFDIIVTGTDTLPPRSVRLQVSPQLLSAGNTVTIMAFVEEGDDMSFGSVTAKIETSTKAVVATVTLYDDGAHNDLDAGDGLFGGSWITTLSETDYLVSILTSDRSGNAAEWNDLAGFTTKTFTVSNKILVVDDDNNNVHAWTTSDPYQSYYTDALDANGLTYDVWECFFRGSPSSSILTQYDVVIWLTGDTYGTSFLPQGYYTETLSSVDQSSLVTYLEGGGTLFICGQDIGYDLFSGDPNDESFYANYLHAAFVQDYTDLFGLHGVAGNPMTDGLYFTISGGDGANNQQYASEIDPVNGAVTILTYDPDATLALQRPLLQKSGDPLERQRAQTFASQPQGINSSGSGAISVDTGTYKVVYFAFGLEAIDNPADRNIIMRKIVHWLQGTAPGSVPQLFNSNSYLVVGDDAYCTDVLGTAKISYGLALGGAVQNPEGRTDIILTSTEHTSGNLIIVGGPGINPVAVEFDSLFGISYNYNPGTSFEILYNGKSIYLDITHYPNEDVCIVYLGENSSRNIMLVWGYGWRGTYAGSMFMGDPATWQKYEGASMLMLRWIDSNADSLVQMSEITVESYEQPFSARTVIRGIATWLRSAADWVLSLLFSTNSYLVVGDDAYCTDVLGTAKISYGLALGGASQNPEGRTDIILTSTEHDSGNLIIVGGPGINPLAVEFDSLFGITYTYDPGVSFQINAEGKSINLDLLNYPQEDVCIVYLGEHNSRNVLMVWGYGWYGSYAGSVFAGDPETWKLYTGAHLFMLRWTDSNGDGLVQKTEITVEEYI